MRETHPTAIHADDGDLVRFLDQQVSPDQRRWLMAHLAQCGECASRMEGLREQSQTLSSLVGSLDEVPDEMTRARALAAARRAQASRSTQRRWYAAGSVRAAAVVAVVALSTLGVEPVRAWIAERWTDLLGSDDLATGTATQPESVLERGSVISFEPASETFVLEIEHPQAVGSVSLELREVSSASAEVVNGQTEEILALPSGLRIANTDSSTASYNFTLPKNLKLIQVFAGGKPMAIIPLDSVQLPWARSVPLTDR